MGDPGTDPTPTNDRATSGSDPTRDPRLADALAALDRAYSPGHHGRWAARRRAELIDETLTTLFARSPEIAAAGRLALVAIGGYGRTELTPGSDIDLLLLHDGEHPDRVAASAEALWYPLWDAGLRVGHVVRTPEECLTFAAGTIDAATAMLDARVLAGDPALWDEADALVRGWVREDPRGFAVRLREVMFERHARYGSVSHHLEPDVKEGSGGLRDIHTLGWLAAVVGEERSAPTLDGVGLLRIKERDEIDAAAEFLTRVRSALRLGGGRGDRLVLDRQPEIARAMGFADEPGLQAVDGLMRVLFTHARQVEHVVGCVFERFLGIDAEAGDPEATPEGVLESFANAAEDRRSLSPSLLDRIEQVEMPTPVRWTPTMRSSFLRILRAPGGGTRTLEAIDRVGLLERYLPAWADVRCRPQRDPYHRYTVDMHLLQTLAGMAELLDGQDSDDPMIGELLASVADRDALLLGALLHDVGKVGRGGHVPAGTRIADQTLRQIGVSGQTRELAVFMVGEHLLLPDTATRRDLGDEDLILSVAATVKTPERLAALLLLSVADASATGPHAQTPWRRTLVRELVQKVRNALERGEMSPDAAQRLDERGRAIRTLLEDDDPAAVESFLERVPPTYLLAVAPDLAAEHFRMLATPLGAAEVRTHTAPGSREGVHELTVIASDRPGLLASVAGALSLAGLSVLTAQVFTTEDDVAVDVFAVRGRFENDLDERRWREFRSSLRAAVEGRISLEQRVADRGRHYPAPLTRSPVEVTVDDAASDFFTVIEVAAPDRPGVLYDITRTLAELGLDVHLAKVATYGERVIDAFYVRDTVGRKISDPAQLGAIERMLADRAAP